MTSNEHDIALKPIERTLYPPIRDLLTNLGFQVIQEIRIEEKEQYIDLLLTYEGEIYVLEVKIGDEYTDLLKGLVQVYEYTLEKNVKNMIVILFPEDLRHFVSSIEELEKKVRFRSCKSLFLTKSWWSLTDWSIDQSLNELKSRIDKKLSASKNIEVISTLLKECIRSLSKLIRMHYKDTKLLDETLNYLTKDQGFFLKLTSKTRKETKIPKKIQDQLINLLAYILINQILFCFLYSKKTKKVSLIERIKNLDELYGYFDEIKKVTGNFRPIFDIDVVSRVPKNKEIIDEINVIIKALAPLEVEEIRHDLYGRLIGKSMPIETRKTLASYYTKVTSSEILAQLSIDRWDEKVWDTACGSGTILVSAYNKKWELYTHEKGLRTTSNDKDEIHKEFLEKQITGTDIMPFACHLTGLNLSAKNLNVYTDFIRIANRNSLDFIELPCEVREAYGDISNAIELIKDPQKYFDESGELERKIPRDQRQESKTFILEKPDAIIINPPFTKLQNLPEEYRKSFSKRQIINICGKTINLWGYFLAHADLILKNGGKLSAIIPVGFLRGKRTRKIRDHILKNYSIDYIIRPAINYCFSEDSNFDDMILIARKNPYEENHETKIVFLHGDILDRTPEDVKSLVKEIRIELAEKIDSEKYSLRKVSQKLLYDNRNNLMPFFFSNEIAIQDTLNLFVERIKANDKMEKLDPKLMEDGLQLRGRERPKESLINRNLGDSRILKSRYYFDQDEDKDYLSYHDKQDGTTLRKEKTSLMKTFRVITDVDTYDITKKFDYLIKFREREKNSTYLMIPNRFDLASESFYSLSSYSEDKIIPLNSFIMYLSPTKEEAKLLCLYFQSIFFLAQILRISKRPKSKGGFANFIEVKHADLKEIFAPTFDKIPKESTTKLLEHFDYIRDKKMPYLIKQLREKTKDRISLDLLVSELLGLNFSRQEIEKIYDTIVHEVT